MVRLFSLHHEFLSEWTAFLNPAGGGKLELKLSRMLFPFMAHHREITVTSLRLLGCFTDGADYRVTLNMPAPAQPAQFGLKPGEVVPGLHSGAPERFDPVSLADDQPVVCSIAIAKGDQDAPAPLSACEVSDIFLALEYTSK